MGVVSCLCLILKSCSIDGNTSSFFLGSFIDFSVLDVFGFLFVGQILGDGRGEGSFTVIDVSDSTDQINSILPLT